jgi:serine/threonine protein kinase
MTATSDPAATRAPCAPPAQWSAFRVGNLPAEVLDALEVHLGTCPVCAAQLDQLPEPPDPLVAELGKPLSPAALTADEARRITDLIEQIGPRSARSELPATGPRLAVGDRLGPYQLHALLGEGGMGQVFRASDSHLGRTVAVKVIAARHWGNPEAVARFRREMQTLARLDHPHIVRAYHADQVEGTLYLAMEYVHGTTLAELVRQHGPLPVAEACAYLAQVADAVQHAHEHGLVHRDIKPGNLIRTADSGPDRVKVLDLGLACLREPMSGSGDLTSAGQSLGTPEYMPPEQWDDSHTVDIRADLYSLGCTLYYLLAGRPPFSAQDYQSRHQLWQAHAQASLPPLREARPDVPAALEAVLQKLLAKAPADRYATPAEVRSALLPFAAPETPSAPREPPTEAYVSAPETSGTRRPPASGRRHRLGRWVLAGAGVAFFLLILVGWRWGFPARNQVEAPLTIVSFKISHYRGDPPVFQGDLGLLSPFTREDDDVRVVAQLSTPAYYYLIAFLPDGREELCFPSDPSTVPPLRADLTYPPEPDRLYGLTDGIGVQAFVLFASKEPLPPYAAWKDPNRPDLWRDWRAVQPPEGVWWGDETELRLLNREERGVREKHRQPAEVAALHHYFQERPNRSALRVVAFSVLAKP